MEAMIIKFGTWWTWSNLHGYDFEWKRSNAKIWNMLESGFAMP